MHFNICYNKNKQTKSLFDMDQGFSWLIDGFVTQFFNLIFNKFLFSFFPNPQNQVGFSRTRVECPISKKERKEGKNLFLFGLICFCRMASTLKG
jgi:hypothetical protein